MKLSLLAFSLFVSSLSFAAAQGVKEFRVQNAVFSADHVQSAGTAVLTVDYDQSKVKMVVERRMPPCPAGKMCAAVMPAPLVVELPIQSVEEKECGIRQVTALEDLRPVDGGMAQITLEDTTDMHCRFLIARRAKATYETAYYDRLNGKEVQSKSILNIVPVEPEARQFETLVLSEGSYLQGFSSLEKPTSGNLMITDDEVQMDIAVRLNCGPGVGCPRYIPQPLMIRLPIVQREKTSCGEVIVARLDTRDADGSLQELRVQDFRTATCKMVLPQHAVQVDYTQAFEGLNGPVEKKARFFFDRQ